MFTIWDQFELDWWDDPISNMIVSILTNYCDDGKISAMASQITGVLIVFITVGSGVFEKASRLCVTRLCVRNSPLAGEFPAQKANNAENVSFDDYNMTYRPAKICQWATSYFTVISIKTLSMTSHWVFHEIPSSTMITNFSWVIWWHVLQNHVSRNLQYFRQSSENDCGIK